MDWGINLERVKSRRARSHSRLGDHFPESCSTKSVQGTPSHIAIEGTTDLIEGFLTYFQLLPKRFCSFCQKVLEVLEVHDLSNSTTIELISATFGSDCISDLQILRIHKMGMIWR
jgi:hypothetical protein